MVLTPRYLKVSTYLSSEGFQQRQWVAINVFQDLANSILHFKRSNYYTFCKIILMPYLKGLVIFHSPNPFNVTVWRKGH